MKKIILEPDEVWSYSAENRKMLTDSMTLIACNDLYGIDIYLTIINNIVEVIVAADDNEVYSEKLVDEDDCISKIAMIYDNYLNEDVVSRLTDDRELSQLDKDYMIDERESELDYAVMDLLDVFAPNYMDFSDDPDKMIEKLKDLISEYLYKSCGISIYRPMYLENENGEDEFEEYPYPEMEI